MVVSRDRDQPKGPVGRIRPIRIWGLGRLSNESRRPDPFIAELELGLERLADRALGDQAALDLRTRRDLEHRVEQSLFDNRLQSARTCAAKKSQLRNGIE